MSRATAQSTTRARAAHTPVPRERTSASRTRRTSPGLRRLQYLALWSRQLYVLVHAGTPLAQALRAVERQTPQGAWRKVLADVRRDIDEGLGLADAMGRHPECFSPVARSLVAAGETSGRLGVMLDRLSRLVRQQLRVRRALLGAITYPCLLMVVASGVTLVMMGFVLPRFASLFESLEVSLPPSTAVLLILSAALRRWWWMIVIALVGTGVAAQVARRNERARLRLDHLFVRMPIFGGLVRNFETARLVRVLGALLQSRVPLLESIALARQSTSNGAYQVLMRNAALQVGHGGTVSGVFAGSSLISPAVAEATRHGEASGQLGSLLVEMADFMDEENEVRMRTITTILEPAILIVMGAAVALLAMSMFLPLFDLASRAHGG